MSTTSKTIFKKENLLFIILGGFFLSNALIAEFIGVKIFSLEDTLGITPFSFSFFGESDLSFALTAGVLLWPVVFIMTDIINEYYGKKGVQILSWLTAAMILYAFLMVWFSMGLHPAEFWQFKELEGGITLDRELAFDTIFGQGLWIIFASLIAFLVSQLVDVKVFQWLRKFTGNKKIWFRATGSTLVSQLIDSFVVLFIAFYIGDNMALELVLAIGLVNYMYKFSIAIILTPLLYVIHWLIDGYLGKETAERLIEEATKSSE